MSLPHYREKTHAYPQVKYPPVSRLHSMDWADKSPGNPNAGV